MLHVQKLEEFTTSENEIPALTDLYKFESSKRLDALRPSTYDIHIPAASRQIDRSELQCTDILMCNYAFQLPSLLLPYIMTKHNKLQISFHVAVQHVCLDVA